jgi:Threonine dehydratase
MSMSMPDLAEVLAARRRIEPYLRPTPLYRYPALDALAGARVWVKHENHQPVGAFKVRGGVNLVSQLTEDERRRGVIAASTGNHGQSVAYAAAEFGVRAVICMPEQANPVKVESMRALGAEVSSTVPTSTRPVSTARSWPPSRISATSTPATSLPCRRRRHLHAGDPRGQAGRRGDRGPGRRRQRRVRGLQ